MGADAATFEKCGFATNAPPPPMRPSVMAGPGAAAASADEDEADAEDSPAVPMGTEDMWGFAASAAPPSAP